MLGDKIKKMRNEKNMTQKELADILDISQSAIGMIEKNQRGCSNELLKKISNFFNVSIDYLLSDSIIDMSMKTPDSDFNEEEIFTQAAHKVGHKGKLSEEELDKIKLALKIALAKDEKNKK